MNNGSRELVSVIVPFLNGSHWLLEALQSVLNQTYTEWELIVIDDGSHEAHSAVARNFCNQYPDKIRYTEHPGHVNRGVSISRNEAARLARGKYLAFLDADDIWLPTKLAHQLSQFAKYPDVAAVFGAFVVWRSWRDENAEDYVQHIGAPSGKCYAPGVLSKKLYPFYDAASPAPSGIMITKDCFQKINGFEPLFSGIYELYEDQAFLSKLYLHETVYVSGTADILYRRREGSMSSAAADVERYHRVRGFYFDWLERYLNRHNIQDEDLYLLIENARKALMPDAQPA